MTNPLTNPMTNPWMSWWSPFPDLTKLMQNISPQTSWFSPTYEVNFAGNREIEADVVSNVASYGTQLSALTKAVLELAKKQQRAQTSRGCASWQARSTSASKSTRAAWKTICAPSSTICRNPIRPGSKSSCAPIPSRIDRPTPSDRDRTWIAPAGL